MIALGAAFALTVASGYAAARVLAPEHPPSLLKLARDLCLGFGIGLGSSSFVFILFSFVRYPGAPGYLFTDVLIHLLILAAALIHEWRRRDTFATGTARNADISRNIAFVFAASFAVYFLTSLFCSALDYHALPHGRWDAWAIWNLRARFFFFDGPHWERAFLPPLQWSSPDYPLLLPSIVAKFWLCLGKAATAVPATLSICFTYAVVLLAMSSVGLLRGFIPGSLAGIAILSNQRFIGLAAHQYADVPLSFFLLASLVLLAFHDEAGLPPVVIGLHDPALHRAADVRLERVALHPREQLGEQRRVHPVGAVAVPLVIERVERPLIELTLRKTGGN